MEMLSTVLPIVIDILLIVLLVVGIILGIKCICIMDKAKLILNNVEQKVNSLNALFSVIELVNSKIAQATDKVAEFFESIINKWINKKNKKSVEEEELESIINEEGNE